MTYFVNIDYVEVFQLLSKQRASLCLKVTTISISSYPTFYFYN